MQHLDSPAVSQKLEAEEKEREAEAARQLRETLAERGAFTNKVLGWGEVGWGGVRVIVGLWG